MTPKKTLDEIKKEFIYKTASERATEWHCYCPLSLDKAFDFAVKLRDEHWQAVTSELVSALEKITAYNKNDGSCPDDNKGPDSMQYWRWQELISRKIADEALAAYKQIETKEQG